MKISTKGRYGTRAVLDLALHYDNSPILVKDIAKRQNISPNYLQHIFIQLATAGIVVSTRGAKGGFSLAKPPSEISIGEVIHILEGSVAPVQCVDNPQICERSGACSTRSVWADVKTAIAGVLDTTTLQDMIEQQNEDGKPEAINC